MHQSFTSHNRFERLVAELFIKLGFADVKTNIEYCGSLGHNYEIDILYGEQGNATVVEVKYYRPNSPPRTELIHRALRQIRTIRQEAKVKNSMLVISCAINEGVRILAKEFSDVEIWDIEKILEKARPFPTLFKDFLIALELDFNSFEIVGDSSANQDQDNEGSAKRGAILAHELKLIEPGLAMAYQFEGACIEALKYLFENDLFGWYVQHETDDGLHRRDLVCRVLPNADVWKLILFDLQSRYVVFEFKNYSEKITQKEIITTERYLYPTALRKVAVIISQNGCAESANKVIQGAMREHGKLIIPITTADLIKLLQEKDQGSDPNTYIFDFVDQFLMGLGR